MKKNIRNYYSVNKFVEFRRFRFMVFSTTICFCEFIKLLIKSVTKDTNKPEAVSRCHRPNSTAL